MSNMSSGYPVQGRNPKTSTNLPSEVLSQISARAHEVYDAISESYNCDCREGHKVHLGLASTEDHSFTEQFEVIFAVKDDISKQLMQKYQASLKARSLESLESGADRYRNSDLSVVLED
jgi:hypothetical protein